MADIRPKDLIPTAETPAADDYLLLDGDTEGTRKLGAPAAFDAGSHTYTPAGAGAIASSVEDRLRRSVYVSDYLVNPATDCIADAIDAAIDAYGTSPDGKTWPGPKIHLPAGVFVMKRTLNLKRRVHITGAGPAGLDIRTPATRIVVDKNIGAAAIILNRYDTIDDTIEDPETTTSAGSLLENFELYGESGSFDVEDFGHGIWLRVRATIRDVGVQRFPDNGINIVARTSVNADPDEKGNANVWHLHNVQSRNNGGHGVFVRGADANAGTGIHVNAMGNGGWGIYDSSFLGNTWIGCHTNNNATGSFKADDDNARSIFVGCYAEGNQPAAEVTRRSMMIGGLIADFSTDSNVMGASSQGVTAYPAVRVRSDNAARELTTYMGTSGSNEFAKWIASGDHASGLQFYWNESTKTYEFRHRRSNSERILAFTSDISTETYGRSAAVDGGSVVFPAGLFVGAGGAARHIMMSATEPTHEGGAGDIVFNTGTGPLLWKYEGGVWVAKWADGETPE